MKKKTQEAFKSLNINSQKDLEQEIQSQLNYLVSEGFVIELPNGKFRMKSQKELQSELI
jgi:hypothetical protein